MRHTRITSWLSRATTAGVGAAVAVAGCAATLVALAPPAGAAVGTAIASNAHDPIGGSLKFRAVNGGLLATGWTSDPDSPSTNLLTYAVLDGTSVVSRVVTSVANAAVATKYGTGPTPSFSLTVPVAGGRHTVCIVGRNAYAGVSTVLGCTTTPFGTPLTSAQTAAHNPVGAVSSYSATASTVRFRGWASDPDYVNRRLLAVLYVDGAPATTVLTNPYPAPRPAKAGTNAAFDITVPVASGTHIGCVWIVDVGLGSNTPLGCNAVDTRGPAGTGALPSPAVNKAVVTEALKHQGQRYVWGAVGPRTFDCSGLVLYSYNKAGTSTPRVSQDQSRAARLIPASRAVPGDLVFTHDSQGDVYHVGIYIKPGLAFAAIDESEGVDYQNIWDPSSATYGSFTHT